MAPQIGYVVLRGGDPENPYLSQARVEEISGAIVTVNDLRHTALDRLCEVDYQPRGVVVGRVGPSAISQFGLRRGDLVSHAQVENRKGEIQLSDGRFSSIISVSGISAEQTALLQNRPWFDTLTWKFPSERIPLDEAHDPTLLILDRFAPVGWGQRVRIVGPPKIGKTWIAEQLIRFFSRCDISLLVVFIGEKREEEQHLRSLMNGGELFFSTVGDSAYSRVVISETALSRAKVLATMGHQVVLLVDSLYRLAKAYSNYKISPAQDSPTTGAIMTSALERTKVFLDAAGNFAEGGSLTVFATALAGMMDRSKDVVADDMTATTNCDWVLRPPKSRTYIQLRPALDVAETATRRPEFLLPEDRLNIYYGLRREGDGVNGGRNDAFLEWLVGIVQGYSLTDLASRYDPANLSAELSEMHTAHQTFLDAAARVRTLCPDKPGELLNAARVMGISPVDLAVYLDSRLTPDERNALEARLQKHGAKPERRPNVSSEDGQKEEAATLSDVLPLTEEMARF